MIADLPPLEYLASGRRSKVYTFTENKKKFVVKIEKENTKAKERIKNEIKFLKILNEEGIGPKLIKEGEGYFVAEFIQGELILPFLEKSKNPYPVLIEVLKQCRVMDELKINKLEMHHPMKHVLIKKNKVVMIDFERCYFTDKPKNVTQFCQFLLRAKRLNLSKERLIQLIKNYKIKINDESFNELIKNIK
ncbi:MAG: phosphotransferase [Candidatus Nanoarchaeia archaeon]